MGSSIFNKFSIQVSEFDVSESATDGSVVEADGCVLLGVVVPADWVTSDITWQASYDGGVTFVPVRDEDNTVVTFAGVTASGANYLAAASPTIGGVTHFKPIAGTNQTSDLEMKVILGIVNP